MKKQQYYGLILHMIQKQQVTRQDISKVLKLSMPTTLQLVNDMMEAHVLLEVGSMASTGGRKAKYLMLNKEVAYAVGLNIGIHHVTIVVLDYIGNVVASTKKPYAFDDSVEWYQKVGDAVFELLEEHSIPKEDVICAGISFPGIIDEKNEMILYSHILNVRNLHLDRFSRMLPFPITVQNDANCGGYNELYSYSPSFTYISLNESVGGAVVVDRKMSLGDTYHAGEIGHMILIPGGKKCYCGKKGCVDAYLSPKNLWGDQKGPDGIRAFLDRVNDGEKDAVETWEEYLENLALLSTNLRMYLNHDIILGGDMSLVLDPYMDQLREKMQKNDIFARNIDYIHTSRNKHYTQSVGAGRLALSKYGYIVLERNGLI